MDKNKEAYLKCNYSEGMFSHEYFVEFNGSHYPGNLGGVFVMKEDIVDEGNSGLMKIAIAMKGKKTSLISVPALGDDNNYFSVQNEDIVCLDKS